MSIGLNAAAISALQTAEGSSWTVGGAVQLAPSVPEPGSLALLGVGLLGLGLGMRRSNR